MDSRLMVGGGHPSPPVRPTRLLFSLRGLEKEEVAEAKSKLEGKKVLQLQGEGGTKADASPEKGR